jgi:guanylate kinase
MNIVVAISEVSRPGSSSVAERVCELIDGVELAVPFTTRLPRSAEDDGFVFTSQDVFERMIASDEFLEHVEIFGHRYGTPRRSLQDARDNGNDLLVRVDERGVSQIKLKLPNALSVLVLHESEHHEHASIANEHLLSRRLQELSQMRNPDTFDHIVTDDGLEESANRVVAIIRAERSRRS